MMYNFFKIAIGVLCLAAAGCASIDDVRQRTTAMNLNISDSENEGILLNLARSSLSEPLSFSALANYTGHQTVGGTVGLPVFGFMGPPPLTFTSLQTTGTSANASQSNDFSYVGNDDNATYAALLQPIDPTTVGYFLRQEYPRELLFFLIVSKIRVINGGRLVAELENNGTTSDEVRQLHAMKQEVPFEKFGNKLQSLIDSGLTAQIDVATNARSKLCFDRLIAPIYKDDPKVHPSMYEPSCANAKIFDTAALGKPKDGNKKNDDKSAKNANPKPVPFADSYMFHDAKTGDEVEIFFRSPFGVYRYLGELIAKKNSIGILRDPEFDDKYIVTINNNEDDCFVSQIYRSSLYCVPNHATTTKKVFSFLHDIVKLYTFPTAAPLTISARLVPGGG